MNSGRETISFRYLVVGSGKILYCADDKREVERYIQGGVPDDTAVFQRRYTVEASLFAIEYEDESSRFTEQECEALRAEQREKLEDTNGTK